VTDTTTVTDVRAAPAHAVPRERNHFRTDPLRRRLLALADTGAALAVCVVAGAFAGADAGLWALAAAPLWLVLAKLHGLYDRDHRSLRHLTVDETPSILTWAVSGTAATLLLLYVAPAGTLGYDGALALFGAAVGTGFVLRVAARALWRSLAPPERALIVGSGHLADMTRRKLRLFTDMHLAPVSQRPAPSLEEIRDDRDWLADTDRVLVATGPVDEALVGELVAVCREHRVKLSVIPPTGAFGTAVQLTRLADLPIVEYNTWDISRSTLLLKRLLDVSLSAIALAILAPLLVATAIAVWLDSSGNPIFVQRRAGRGGRPFRMLKFRTMVADAEERLDEVVSLDDLSEPMFKVPDDPRVTRLGGLLRRTSLDELPQLLNVLRGEMSLVGPRPEQVELVERYEPEHRFRLAVKPGITGPMQVFGRGELTFEERLAVERDYIENLSFGRDLRILAMTIAAVVGGRGAY
jgi:exopolysaccharide biosynthesis polyprenyl glycosylphosphotransferase